MSQPLPKRGEIWWVDWSPARLPQSGLRPAVIVQTDAANQNPRYPNTIVVALSTKGRAVPFHALIDPSPANGLTSRSYVKCEQLLTVSKDRLQGLIGTLSADELKQVGEALLLVLDP